MEFQDCSDARLAALVRERQGDAFAELSARYLGLIRAKAKLFEGAAAPEKEDLWQEGLLGLYAAAISFRPEGGASFSTYAGVCVYNRMTSAVRRHVSSGNRTLNESVPLEDAGDAAVSQVPRICWSFGRTFGPFSRGWEYPFPPWSAGSWLSTSTDTAEARRQIALGSQCGPMIMRCIGCVPS